MTTQKKLNINMKLLLYIVLGVSVALMALRIYMIEALYENEMYAFVNGTLLPDLFNYFIFAAVVAIFLLFSFVEKEKLPCDIGATSTWTVVFSAITGFLALVGGLYAISQIMISDNEDSLVMQAVAQQDVYANRLSIFVKIQCVLSLAVFAYFMLTAFSVNKYSRVKSVLGMLTIVWHVMFLLVIYFDMSKPINSPLKMMFQFAVLTSMIYMVYEMRFMLGIGKPRMYVAVSLVSVMILCVAAVPMAIGAVSGAFNVLLSNLLYSLQLIGMLGYIISRLITYLAQGKAKAQE